MTLQALARALSAIGNAVLPSSKVTDHDADGRLAAPAPGSVFRERLAGDAPRGAVVEGVERRVGDGRIDRQHLDPRGAQALADLDVRGRVVEVLDVEIDLAARRVLDIGERLLWVSVVVVEHEIDRVSACRQGEALANLAAREPRPLERGARLLREVRERDRVATLLRRHAGRAGSEPRQQEQAGEDDPQKTAPAP